MKLQGDFAQIADTIVRGSHLQQQKKRYFPQRLGTAVADKQI
jgi:hypothetical protein